jgi:dehydrogenase/reductase SDR family protein 1
MFEGGESIELSGQAVAHLAADANIMSKSGRILMTGDLAREYGFVDVDGETHDMRSVSKYLAGKGHTWIAAVIPGFIRVPLFVLHYMSYKF